MVEELRQEISAILRNEQRADFSIEGFTSQDFEIYGKLSTMSDSEWQVCGRLVAEAWLKARLEVRARGGELPSDEFPRSKVKNFLAGLRR